MHRDSDLPATAPSVEPADRPFAESAFAESVAIMARLRAPDGCPWDRKQSFDSIRKNTLEETYEVLDAIERRDWPNLREELGDLLLQVLFYAQMASESEAVGFSITDVLDELNRKLIRRHPHVFGEEASRRAGNTASVDAAESSEQVLANWEAIKQAEKRGQAEKRRQAEKNGQTAQPASRLDAVSRSQPALAEAAQIGSAAARVHFDWPQWQMLLDKLSEETAELVAEATQPEDAPRRQARMEAELGDMLFTVAQLARHLHVDAEMALRAANLRFRRRFASMEQMAGDALPQASAEELEALWQRAKQAMATTEAEES